MSEEINGYQLSRAWFDFCFENPELIKPSHTAVYMFAIEHCNRMGWKDKFGFPSQMAMDAIGIKKYQTYIATFNDLVSWGFFKLIQKSKNQYSSNIISLINALPKNGKALDKAIKKHRAKQLKSTGQSKDSIYKLYKQEEIYKEKESMLAEVGTTDLVKQDLAETVLVNPNGNLTNATYSPKQPNSSPPPSPAAAPPLSLYERFRELMRRYPGSKDAYPVLFKSFQKQCKENRLREAEELTHLSEGLDRYLAYRSNIEQAQLKDTKLFIPPHKNAKTWINNLGWQADYELPKNATTGRVVVKFEEL
jgi:hypothetical protein